MEQILNAKIRNQAFGKFILFFVITVAIVVMAVYFNFIGVPANENQLLREKVRSYEDQTYRQEQFLTAMETSKKLIDSMGRSEQLNPLLDKEIAEQLKAIKDL